MKDKLTRSEEEWKKTLTPECYSICRGKGTEQPFNNKYWDCHAKGTYACAACGKHLFRSKDKYDSGSGWPSFSKPFNEDCIDIKIDFSLGMKRNEVVCSRCDSHLGHVFDDGPEPLYKRYCINSASLNLLKFKT